MQTFANLFLFKKRNWTKNEILGRSNAEIHPEPTSHVFASNSNKPNKSGNGSQYGSTATMSSNPNQPRIESVVEWTSVVNRYRMLTGKIDQESPTQGQRQGQNGSTFTLANG